MAESQLSELQNMRVLLEEARGLSRNLAYHRRARLEARIGEALEEVERQIATALVALRKPFAPLLCSLPGRRVHTPNKVSLELQKATSA
jgi:hypothetical protein